MRAAGSLFVFVVVYVLALDKISKLRFLPGSGSSPNPKKTFFVDVDSGLIAIGDF